jgi:phosphohistidine phosphatase SixA
MKFSLLFLLVVLLASCSSTIYIVRHAEKSTEPKNNPHLTDAGKERANTLAALLKNKKIKDIYSTNTNRTVETATPLSIQANVPIQFYGNDTLRNFFQQIFIHKRNTLVVGHSNTVLKMLETMQLKGKVKIVLDNEFNNLFKIKVKRYCFDCVLPFKAKLYEKTYGNAPVAIDSTAVKMQ